MCLRPRLNNPHRTESGRPYQSGAQMATRYGKYRGTVVDNVDPMMVGRLRVAVPAVDLSGVWAMPCFPLAGHQSGAWLMPGPGSGVWVEFEEGDVDQPIWTGSWYGSAADVPPLALEASPATPPIALQTPGQASIRLSDAPGRPVGSCCRPPLGGASPSLMRALRSPTARAPPSPSSARRSASTRAPWW